ncbi:hypothetical protein H1C71_028555 [Ictidomys tridecemlineatus]|nr:hypothetical protein H1C71_028555 [Ictidomys tridecemlineatus]
MTICVQWAAHLGRCRDACAEAEAGVKERKKRGHYLSTGVSKTMLQQGDPQVKNPLRTCKCSGSTCAEGLGGPPGARTEELLQGTHRTSGQRLTVTPAIKETCPRLKVRAPRQAAGPADQSTVTAQCLHRTPVHGQEQGQPVSPEVTLHQGPQLSDQMCSPVLPLESCYEAHWRMHTTILNYDQKEQAAREMATSHNHFSPEVTSPHWPPARPAGGQPVPGPGPRAPQAAPARPSRPFQPGKCSEQVLGTRFSPSWGINKKRIKTEREKAVTKMEKKKCSDLISEPESIIAKL